MINTKFLVSFTCRLTLTPAVSHSGQMDYWYESLTLTPAADMRGITVIWCNATTDDLYTMLPGCWAVQSASCSNPWWQIRNPPPVFQRRRQPTKASIFYVWPLDFGVYAKNLFTSDHRVMGFRSVEWFYVELSTWFSTELVESGLINIRTVRMAGLVDFSIGRWQNWSKAELVQNDKMTKYWN